MVFYIHINNVLSQFWVKWHILPSNVNLKSNEIFFTSKCYLFIHVILLSILIFKFFVSFETHLLPMVLKVSLDLCQVNVYRWGDSSLGFKLIRVGLVKDGRMKHGFAIHFFWSYWSSKILFCNKCLFDKPERLFITFFYQIIMDIKYIFNND